MLKHVPYIGCKGYEESTTATLLERRSRREGVIVSRTVGVKGA